MQRSSMKLIYEEIFKISDFRHKFNLTNSILSLKDKMMACRFFLAFPYLLSKFLLYFIKMYKIEFMIFYIIQILEEQLLCY